MTSVTFDGVRFSTGRNVDNIPEEENRTNQTGEESIFVTQLNTTGTKSSANPTNLPEHDGFHLFDRTEWDSELGDAIGCKGALSKAGDAIGGFFSGIGNFFGNIFNGIGNFFARLFGGDKKDTDEVDDKKTEDLQKERFEGISDEIIEQWSAFADPYGDIYYDTDGELIVETRIGNDDDEMKDFYAQHLGEVRYDYVNEDGRRIIGIAVNVQNESPSEKNLETRDGAIGDTKQGQIGDCWLLSGVNALSYTEEGKQIIKDALEYHDGYTTVHLKGAKDYNVTDEEVEKARIEKYSTGDDDMLILELAIKKAFEDVNTKDIMLNSYNMDNSIANHDGVIADGSYPINLLYLLTGKKGSEKFEAYSGYDGMSWKDNLDEAFDAYRADKENMPTVLSAHTETTIQDINGNDVKIYAPHAYALKEVTGDTITFTNPHNSGADITVSRDVALNTFSSYSNCDLSDSNPTRPATLPAKVYNDGTKVYVKESGSNKNVYIDAYTKDGEPSGNITIYCFNAVPSTITRWNTENKEYENYNLPEGSALSANEIANKIVESNLINRNDLTLEEIVEKYFS